MFRFVKSSEKTNSFIPENWAWSKDPFPAFRGSGQRYRAFQAVAGGYQPWIFEGMSDDFTKIITTKKGTRLMVPCTKQEDEKILFITATGGFRGHWGRMEGVGAEILFEEDSTMHCTPCAHIVARVTDLEGYVVTETGNRSGRGIIEVYSWKYGYFEMPAQEYEAAVETGALFAGRKDAEEAMLLKCRERHEAEAASAANKKTFEDRLKAAGETLAACRNFVPHDPEGVWLGKTGFHTVTKKGNPLEDEELLYTEENVRAVEEKAQKHVAWDDLCDRHRHYAPQFKEMCRPLLDILGADDINPWDHSILVYNDRFLVYSEKHHDNMSFDYTEEGRKALEEALPELLEEYADWRAGKEEQARKKAEEAAAKAAAEKAAREAAERQAQREAKAAEMGLPGDITVWCRTGGRTHCGNGWVITPEGTDRKEDRFRTEGHDGYKVWNQVCEGELVLQWEKSNTAAEHVFTVLYRPESLTESQLERVAEIQEGIEARWAGLAGLVSKIPSPPVGKGWGLF